MMLRYCTGVYSFVLCLASILERNCRRNEFEVCEAIERMKVRDVIFAISFGCTSELQEANVY